jgi:hypothetical protein
VVANILLQYWCLQNLVLGLIALFSVLDFVVTGLTGCIVDGVGEKILCQVGAECGQGDCKLVLDVFKESF